MQPAGDCTPAAGPAAAACPPAAGPAAPPEPEAAAPHLGGFEEWSALIGGVLAHAGITGFLANLDELYQRVDEEGAQWLAFLTAWHEALGETEITAAQLVRRLRDARGLLAALPDALADGLADPRRSAGLTRQPGKALARRADMVLDESGLCLVRSRYANSRSVVRWRVTRQQGFRVCEVFLPPDQGNIDAVQAELEGLLPAATATKPRKP